MSLEFLSSEAGSGVVSQLTNVLLGRSPSIGGGRTLGAAPTDFLAENFRLECSEDLKQKFEQGLHRLLDDLSLRWTRGRYGPEDAELLAQVVVLAYRLPSHTLRGQLVDLLHVEELRKAESTEGNLHLLLLDTAIKLRATIPDQILHRDLSDIRFGWLAVYGFLQKSLNEGLGAFEKWERLVRATSEPTKSKKLELSLTAFRKHIAQNYPAEVAASAGVLNCHDGLVPHVNSYMEMVRRVQSRQLLAEQSDVMGRAMETQNGSRAALYLVCGDSCRLVAALNHTTAANALHVNQKSIAALVARTSEGYISADVGKDPHYLATDPRTRSEIAVPIRYHKSTLGVLNIESNRLGAFHADQLPDMQKQAMRLAPLLILQRSQEENPKYAIPIRFTPSDWGLSQLLRPICMEACAYFERVFGSRPSCTVWEYDRDKRVFHARVASGNDYEYQSSRKLPSGRGFTNRVFGMERGSVVIEPYTNVSREFLRPDKAETLGIKVVASAAIVFPNSGNRFGVVTFYFFSHVENIRKEDILGFSEQLGGVIEHFNSVTPPVVESYVESTLVNTNAPADAKPEVLRKLIEQIMQSDYSSIFVADQTGQTLRCISTSGLMKDGRLLHWFDDEATYDLESGNGMTVTVARNPGSCLRKNDSKDEKELVTRNGSLMPSNWLYEAFAFGVIDHRRILVASVKAGGKLLGVVRVNRPETSDPYIKSDESKLLAICRASHNVLLSAMQSLPQIVTFTPMTPVSIIASLIGGGINETTTDNFLRDALHIIADNKGMASKGVHLFVQRVLSTNDGALLETAHSVTTLKEPIRLGEPKLRYADRIISRAIELQAPISFSGGVHVPKLHQYSASVKSGLAIPFSVWNPLSQKGEQWVLNVEFGSVCRNIRDYLLVSIFIAMRLQRLLSPSFKPNFDGRPIESLESFASAMSQQFRGHRSLEAEFNRRGSPIRFSFSEKGIRRSAAERPSDIVVELNLACLNVGRIRVRGLRAGRQNADFIRAAECRWDMFGMETFDLYAGWLDSFRQPTDEKAGVAIWPNSVEWSKAPRLIDVKLRDQERGVGVKRVREIPSVGARTSRIVRARGVSRKPRLRVAR